MDHVRLALLTALSVRVQLNAQPVMMDSTLGDQITTLALLVQP